MIKTENLTKAFRIASVNPLKKAVTNTALRGVTLHVPEGEILALVGRNGAGKTTLLKILSTLVLSDGGRAEVCGFDVSTKPGEVKRRIGVITGEERSFYWRLTGRQNITLFGALYNVPAAKIRERVDDMLAKVGLAEHADVAVRAYSSGMLQRLSIARGMLHEPKVILMDEPSKSADPMLQARFVKYVREEIVAGQGCTVIFATHNLEEAISLGGNVAVIEKGAIEYTGKPDNAKELNDMLAGFSKDTGKAL